MRGILSSLLWASAGVTGILALGVGLRLPQENAKLLFPALVLWSVLAVVLARHVKAGGALTRLYAILALVLILPLMAFVGANIGFMFAR